MNEFCSVFPTMTIWKKLREQYAIEQQIDIRALQAQHAKLVLGDVAYTLHHPGLVMEEIMWQREQRAYAAWLDWLLR